MIQFISAALIAAVILLLSLFDLRPADGADRAGLSALTRTASSGRSYLQIDAGASYLDFELSRPQRSDANILLCIPAAFTSQDGGLCGLYASRGAVGNTKLVDRKIDGAIKMDAGKARIFDTNSGANLDSVFVSKLKAEKSSFFQQFQVVKDKHAESFRDKSHFQRRCIAVLADGSVAVIESAAEITFSEFGQDLVDLGVQDAVYTDMGPWSEGWYRDEKTGESISIGESRMMTNKQTNWFVLRKNTTRL